LRRLHGSGSEKITATTKTTTTAKAADRSVRPT
jgi:hypothetical protein